MSPESFVFKLTVPNDPAGADVVAIVATHAVRYAQIEAGKAAGWTTSEDINGSQAEGFALAQSTIGDAGALGRECLANRLENRAAGQHQPAQSQQQSRHPAHSTKTRQFPGVLPGFGRQIQTPCSRSKTEHIKICLYVRRSLDKLVSMLRAAGDPTRLRLLLLLREAGGVSFTLDDLHWLESKEIAASAPGLQQSWRTLLSL